MRFQQKEFTASLKSDIDRIEMNLARQIEAWLPYYQDLFLQNYKVLEVGLEKEGSDYFLPGSKSTLFIKVSDDNEELIDLQTIQIWSCERFFMGVPVSKPIPGSKAIGELLDEPVEKITEKLHEYVKSFIDR